MGNYRPMSEMMLDTIGIDPLVPTGNNVIATNGFKASNPNTVPPWGGALEVEIVATAYREATGTFDGPNESASELAALAAAAAARVDSWTTITHSTEGMDSHATITDVELLVDNPSPTPDTYRFTAVVRDNKWICRFKPPHTSRMKIRMVVDSAFVDIDWAGAAGITLGGVPSIFRRAPGQSPQTDEDWIYDPDGERVWSFYDGELSAPLVYASTYLRGDPAWPPA